jgi:hypothetical protein
MIGVDPNATLLEAFAARAGRLGIAHTEVESTWPDAAPRVPDADVVVCHHLVYNVPDLASFASALDSRARRRVVLELTAVHPMAWLAPYWMELHGLAQPDTPTAQDAAEVLVTLGFAVQQQRWQRAVEMIGELGDDQVARIARRLCLEASRVPELRHLLATTPPPTDRDVVTMWVVKSWTTKRRVEIGRSRGVSAQAVRDIGRALQVPFTARFTRRASGGSPARVGANLGECFIVASSRSR